MGTEVSGTRLRELTCCARECGERIQGGGDRDLDPKHEAASRSGGYPGKGAPRLAIKWGED